jgi:uncharacterized membrane protein YdbT with pleckstrin-like domain
VALLRGRRFFAPFLAWAAIVFGVLALVPVLGFFATFFAGIWIVIISLGLFSRSEAVDRLCEHTHDARPPQPAT